MAAGGTEREQATQGVPDQHARLSLLGEQVVDRRVDGGESTAVKLRDASGAGGQFQDVGRVAAGL